LAFLAFLASLAVPLLLAGVLAMSGCSKGGPSGASGRASSDGGAAGKAPKLDALIGKEAPDWELQDHTGRVWRLRDLRGDVVVLISWEAG
jgi:hypothetical protein